MCLLAVVLATASLGAQAQDAGVPYSLSQSGRINLGTTPLRIWHATRGYAQEQGETAIGGRLARPSEYGIYFGEAQWRESNSGNFGLNLGFGTRWRYKDPVAGGTRIMGVSGWYDGMETNLDNFFNQGGVSFESLGDMIDLRFNANIPGNGIKLSDTPMTDDFFYTGNVIRRTETTRGDVSLSNVTGEIALRVPETNIWGYASGYQLDGNQVSTGGYKLGARGYVYNDLVIDLGVSDDDEFGTLTTFQVIWTPGRVSSGFSSSVHNINDRMREPVYRPMYVATQQRTFFTGISDITDENGDVQRIVHVDSTATAPGDGTFESPLTSLDDIFANSMEDDIILVHSGSTHTGESATLQTDQRFLGEGNDVVHTISSQDFGVFQLPETSAGAASGAVPIIDGAPIAAMQVGAAALADATAIEVNNFQVTNGDVGIRSEATGTGTLNVANVTITDTGSHGIEVVSSDATYNLTDVTVTDAGDAAGEAGVKITGGDANFNMSGQIAQGAAATSAAAVQVDGGHTGTVNMVLPAGAATGDLVVDAQNGTGLQFDNADGQYVINGPVELNGGDAGIDMLNGTDGAITLTDTTITNPTSTAINVEEGLGSMNFTGQVNQANAATALAVSAGHNGTLDFNEATANTGVFNVTNGDGLQFNNADGAYRFNDQITLNGGDAGIDILGGSEGTFVFSEATITNPTGDALVVRDSAAGGGVTSAIVTYQGEITTNAGRSIVADNNANATIVVDATVDDQGTGILVQNNTGGAVRIAGRLNPTTNVEDEIVLNTGANNAVTVLSNTNTAVSFEDLDITTTSGTGLLVNNTQTLEVTGTTNTIVTTTGTGLSIADTGISANGATFESVSADGAAQAIVLNNVTGGLVTVGEGGTTAGDGGTLANITGTAISITNAENVTINAMDITANLAAMQLDFNSGSTSNVRVTNNLVTNSGSAEAFLLTTSGATAKTVNQLIQGNTFNNNDPTAFAADIRAEGTGDVNATLLDNTFANTDAATGVPVRVQADNAGADLKLNLGGDGTVGNRNTATPGNGANDGYELNQITGDFSVADLANVNANNDGTVSTSGTIVNEPDPIPTPP